MNLTSRSPEPSTGGLRLAVLVEGGLGVVAVGLAWLLGVSLSEQLPDNWRAALVAVGRGAVATLPLLAAFWWVVHAQYPACQRLRSWMQWLVDEVFPQSGLAQLALVAALAGVGEELMFRGVLQSAVAHWTTPLAGLLVASLMFGLFHALSKLYFLLATLIGLYFGWLVLLCDDLVVAVVAHGLYDFLALAYLARHRRPPTHLPPNPP